MPAATLVLLRDAPGGGVETLLIQRHTASRFAGGDFVFPGGKVEAADVPEDVARWCRGLPPADAARRLGVDGDARAALGYWTGALREAFEEVGMLLARDAQDRPVRVDHPRFAAHRLRCQRDHRAFWEMLEAEALVLPLDGLVYFAHWITPEERPLRFDTRFFAAEAPAGQEPVADEHEIIGVRWLTPAAALQAYGRGELSLRLPTARNLGLFSEATSVADALRRLGRLQVSMIRPRMVSEDGRARTLLPGDPGYY